MIMLLKLSGFAQLEGHRWYFTNPSTRGITFDFVNNNPVNTAEHVNPYCNEGSGVANNPITGDLLFYVTTNEIRDASHLVMPNGSSITNNQSNTQKGIICPRPGYCSQYYIFQNTSAKESSPGNVYYSLVDLSLPGNGTVPSPLGEVVAGQKNIFLKNNSAEAACIIKSTSSNVFWLIISTYDVNELYIYRIDSTGISLSSNYNVPFTITDFRDFNYSYQSNKLALVSCVENEPSLLFDFNRTTGTITSANIIPGTPVGTGPNYWEGMYDLEWSSDGTKLYLGKWRVPSGVTGGRVYQYDLNLPANPVVNVFTAPGGYNNIVAGLKRGPDNRIYIIYSNPTHGFRYLGVINNPNSAGMACNPVLLGYDLGYNVGAYGKFPHHIPSNEKPIALNDTINLQCSDNLDIQVDVLANDVDPDDNHFNLNFLSIPPELEIHINSNQTINIQLDTITNSSYVLPYTICDLKCFSKCDTGYIVIQFDTTMSMDFLTSPVQLCMGDSVELISAISGDAYEWNTGATGSNLMVDSTGQYILEVTIGNCRVIDTSDVFMESQMDIDLGPDVTICDSISYELSSSIPGENYLWNTGDTTSSIIINASGMYYLEASNVCNNDIDSIWVTFDTTPTLTLGSDQYICNGDSVMLTSTTTESNILWNTGDSVLSIWTSTPGLYWASSSNMCGFDQDTIQVDLLPNPTLNPLGADTVLCDINPFVLNATSSDGNILWNTGDTMSTIIVANTGLYWIQVSNACGVLSDSILITLENSPTISTNNDTTICYGNSVDLVANTSSTDILWNTGDTISSITVSNAGVYWVSAGNNCGTAADTVILNVTAFPGFNLGPDTVICNSSSVDIFAYPIGYPIIWNNGSEDSVLTVSSTGFYSATVTSPCGSYQDTIEVQFNLTPNINLGPDVLLCEGDTLVLDASWPNASYVWNNLNIDSIIYITSSGNYSVQVSNNCGSSTDSIDVQVLPSTVNIQLPNVFTPNGNGVNDQYTIPGLEDVESFYIEFYDRWGVLLYSTRDFSLPWKGTTNDNKLVPEGVYYVIFQFKNCDGNQITKTEFVTIFH